MMTFKLTADAEFHAENIVDALGSLGDYFHALSETDAGDVEPIFHKGTIEVTKIAEGDEAARV